MAFEEMWAELAPVGRSSRTGGYFRQPFETAEVEAYSWFLSECRRRQLRVVSDGFGNTVGWWDVDFPRDVDALPGVQPVSSVHNPALQADGVLTGSHLDSVRDGGAYDGPLGVVSALSAVDVLRERGFTPARPIGVAVFREEEGSRFPLACLGSRLATGVTAWNAAASLKDRDGVALGDLVDGSAGHKILDGVGVFVELHVEQGRDLVDRDVAIGVGTAIWPHGRYRFDFSGEANHAGTTAMDDRHDPMLSYAMTVLAANKQARLNGRRATFGRVVVEPNGTNAVPSHVTGWLDARAPTTDGLLELVAEVERLGVERAGRDGTDLVVTPESVSTEVLFADDLVDTLTELGGWPAIPTAAGHDAGILSGAGIPTAMLFVRNPTGISHSPLEHAEMADCLTGVRALADTLAVLAGSAA